MRNLLYLFCLLLSATAFAQTGSINRTDVYRLFDDGLTMTRMAVSVSASEITLSGNNADGEPYKFSTPLFSTVNKNVFFFDDSKLDKVAGPHTGRYTMLQLDEAHKMLELYLDTAFMDRKGIESFIANDQNLLKTFAFVLIAGPDLRTVQSFPAITAITPADLEMFQKLDQERQNKIAPIDEQHLPEMLKLKLFLKQYMIISQHCILLGYRPPDDKKEFDFLRGFFYKK